MIVSLLNYKLLLNMHVLYSMLRGTHCLPTREQTYSLTNRMVRCAPICSGLLVCFIAAIVTGCGYLRKEVGFPIQPFAHRGQVQLFAAYLKRETREDQLSVARYEVARYSAGGTLRITFDLTYYTNTRPPVSSLPTNAIIVLLRRDGKPYELLGRDASYSIIPDTPQNRKEWAAKCLAGAIVPPRNMWLEQKAAENIARSAALIPRESVNYMIHSVQRYELGWIIYFDRRGSEKPIGSEISVVVGDDRQVKCIYWGL